MLWILLASRGEGSIVNHSSACIVLKQLIKLCDFELHSEYLVMGSLLDYAEFEIQTGDHLSGTAAMASRALGGMFSALIIL